MTGWFGVLLLVAAATGSGLIGGLFFGFSNFIMRGLARLPPEQGAAAMQSINVTVLNPLFLTVFLGTGLIALAAIVPLLSSNRTAAILAVVGAALYLVGSIGVTMAFNVPLNNMLARIGLTDASLSANWSHYLDAWTKWNHVRTIASLLAAVLFGVAAAR